MPEEASGGQSADVYSLRSQFSFEVAPKTFTNMSQIVQQLGGIEQAVQQTSRSINRTGGIGSAMQQSASQANAATNTVSQTLRSMASETKMARQRIAPLKNEFRALRAASRNIRFGGLGNPRVFRRAVRDANEYTRALAQLESQITGTTAAEREFAETLKRQRGIMEQRIQLQKAQREAALSAERVGQFKTLADVGSRALRPMINQGKVATQVFANFDNQMAGLAAITNATGKDLEDLRNKSKQLGATTRYTAAEAAEAASFLGMAGFKTEAILSGLSSTLNLASAGNLSLAESADIASNVLSGFQMDVETLGHVTDVLARTSTSANTNVQQLGIAMSYAAPNAKLFGATVEETAALIGVMSNAGIQADKAGTAARGAFLKLAAPTAAGQKSLAEFGVSLTDTNGNMRNIIDVFNELSGKLQIDPSALKMLQEASDGSAESLEGLGEIAESRKIKALKNIFGTTGISGAAAAMGQIQELNRLALANQGSSFDKQLLEKYFAKTQGIQAKEGQDIYSAVLESAPSYGAASQMMEKATQDLMRANLSALSGRETQQLRNYFTNQKGLEIAAGDDLFTAINASAPDTQTALGQINSAMEALQMQFDQSAGAAKTMASIMEANLAGSFRALGSALEAVRIAFIEPLVPLINLVVKAATKFLLILANLPAPVRGIIGITLGLVTAITALATIVGFAGAALFSFAQAEATVTAASVALSSSMVPLTGFFGEFVAQSRATSPLAAYFQRSGEAAESFGAAVKSVSGDTTEGIAKWSSGFNTLTKSIRTSSIAFLTSPWGIGIVGFLALNTILEQLVPNFNLLGTILSGIAAPLGFLWGLLKGLTASLFNIVRIGSGGAFKPLVAVFDSIGNALTQMQESFQLFSASGEKIGLAIGNTIIRTMEMVGYKVQSIWDFTIAAIRAPLKPFSDFVAKIGYIIQHALAEGSPGTTERIRYFWGITVDYLQGLFNRLIGFARLVNAAFLGIGEVTDDERMAARNTVYEATVGTLIQALNVLPKLAMLWQTFQRTQSRILAQVFDNLDLFGAGLMVFASLPMTLAGQLEKGADLIISELRWLTHSGIPRALVFALPAGVAIAISTGLINTFEQGFNAFLDSIPGHLLSISNILYGFLSEDFKTRINAAISEAVTGVVLALPDLFGQMPENYRFDFNMDRIFEGFQTFVSSTLTGFIAYLHDVGQISKEVGANVAAMMQPILSFRLTDIIGEFGTALLLLGGIVTRSGTLINMAMAAFAPYLPYLTTILPLQRAIFVELPASPAFRGILNFVTKTILPAITGSLRAISSLVFYLINAFTGLPLAAAFLELTKGIRRSVRTAVSILPYLPQIILSTITAIAQGIGTLTIMVFRVVGNYISTLSGIVVDAIAGLLIRIPYIGEFLAATFIKASNLVRRSLIGLVKFTGRWLVQWLKLLWQTFPIDRFRALAPLFKKIFLDLGSGVVYAFREGLAPIFKLVPMLDPFRLMTLYFKTGGFQGVLKKSLWSINPFDILFSPMKLFGKNFGVISEAARLLSSSLGSAVLPANIVRTKLMDVVKVTSLTEKQLLMMNRGMLNLDQALGRRIIPNLIRFVMLANPMAQIIGRVALATLFWYSVLKPLNREFFDTMAQTEVFGMRLNVLARSLQAFRAVVITTVDTFFFIAQNIGGWVKTIQTIFNILGVVTGVFVHEVSGILAIFANVVKALIINPLTLLGVTVLGALDTSLRALQYGAIAIKFITKRYGDVIAEALHGNIGPLFSTLFHDLIMLPVKLTLKALQFVVVGTIVNIAKAIGATFAEIGRLIRDPIGETQRLFGIVATWIEKRWSKVADVIGDTMNQLQLDRLGKFMQHYWRELSAVGLVILRILGYINPLTAAILGIGGAVAFLINEYRTGFQSLDAIIQGLSSPIETLDRLIRGLLAFTNVYLPVEATQLIAGVIETIIKGIPLIIAGIFTIGLVMRQSVFGGVQMVIESFSKLIGYILRGTTAVRDLGQGMAENVAGNSRLQVGAAQASYKVRSRQNLLGIRNPFAYSKDVEIQGARAKMMEQGLTKSKAALAYQKEYKKMEKAMQREFESKLRRFAKSRDPDDRARALGGKKFDAASGRFYDMPALMEKRQNRWGMEQYKLTQAGRELAQKQPGKILGQDRADEYKRKAAERSGLGQAFEAYGQKLTSEQLDAATKRTSPQDILREVTTALNDLTLERQDVKYLYVAKSNLFDDKDNTLPNSYQSFDEQMRKAQRHLDAKNTDGARSQLNEMRTIMSYGADSHRSISTESTFSSYLIPKILADIQSASNQRDVRQQTGANLSRIQGSAKLRTEQNGVKPAEVIQDLAAQMYQSGDFSENNPHIKKIADILAKHYAALLADHENLTDETKQFFKDFTQANQKYKQAEANIDEARTGIRVYTEGVRELAQETAAAAGRTTSSANESRRSIVAMLTAWTGIPQAIEATRFNQRMRSGTTRLRRRVEEQLENERRDARYGKQSRERGFKRLLANRGLAGQSAIGGTNKLFEPLKDGGMETGQTLNFKGYLHSMRKTGKAQRRLRTDELGQIARAIYEGSARDDKGRFGSISSNLAGAEFIPGDLDPDQRKEAKKQIQSYVNKFKEELLDGKLYSEFRDAETDRKYSKKTIDNLVRRYLKTGGQGVSDREENLLKQAFDTKGVMKFDNFRRIVEKFQQNAEQEGGNLKFTKDAFYQYIKAQDQYIRATNEELEEMRQHLGLSYAEMRDLSKVKYENPLRQMAENFGEFFMKVKDQVSEFDLAVQRKIDNIEYSLGEFLESVSGGFLGHDFAHKVVDVTLRRPYFLVRSAVMKTYDSIASQYRQVFNNINERIRNEVNRLGVTKVVKDVKRKFDAQKDNSLMGLIQANKPEDLKKVQAKFLREMKNQGLDKTQRRQAILAMLQGGSDDTHVRKRLQEMGVDVAKVSKAVQKATNITEQRINSQILDNPKFTTAMYRPFQTFLMQHIPHLLFAGMNDARKTFQRISAPIMDAIARDVGRGLGPLAPGFAKMVARTGDKVSQTLYKFGDKIYGIFGQNFATKLLERTATALARRTHKVVGEIEGAATTAGFSVTGLVIKMFGHIGTAIQSITRAVTDSSQRAAIWGKIKGFFTSIGDFFNRRRGLNRIERSMQQNRESQRQLVRDRASGERTVNQNLGPFSWQREARQRGQQQIDQSDSAMRDRLKEYKDLLKQRRDYLKQHKGLLQEELAKRAEHQKQIVQQSLKEQAKAERDRAQLRNAQRFGFIPQAEVDRRAREITERRTNAIRNRRNAESRIQAIGGAQARISGNSPMAKLLNLAARGGRNIADRASQAGNDLADRSRRAGYNELRTSTRTELSGGGTRFTDFTYVIAQLPKVKKAYSDLLKSGSEIAGKVGNKFRAAATATETAWAEATRNIIGGGFKTFIRRAAFTAKKIVGSLNHGASDVTAEAWNRAEHSVRGDMQQMEQQAARSGDRIANEMHQAATQSRGFFGQLGQGVSGIGKTGMAVGAAIGAAGMAAQTIGYSLMNLGILDEKQSEVMMKMSEIVTIIGAVTGLGMPLLQVAMTALPTITTLLTTAGTAITGIGTTLATSMGFAATGFAPILLGIAAISAAATLLYFGFKNNFLGIRTIVQGLGFVLSKALIGPLAVIRFAWQKLAQGFAALISPVLGAALTLGGNLISALNCSPTVKIPLAWQGAVEKIKGSFGWLVSAGEWASGALSAIFNPVLRLFGAGKKEEAEQKGGGGIVGALGGFIGGTFGRINDFLHWTMETIATSINWVADLIKPLQEPVRQIADFFEALALIADSVSSIHRMMKPIAAESKQFVDAIKMLALALYNIRSIIESTQWIYNFFFNKKALSGGGQKTKPGDPLAKREDKPVKPGIGEVVQFGKNAATIYKSGKQLAPVIAGGAKLAQQAWGATVGFIKNAFFGLAGDAQTQGYEIQKGISEGSPGTTRNIRDNWAVTENAVKGNMDGIAAQGQQTGQVLGDKLSGIDVDIKPPNLNEVAAQGRKVGQAISDNLAGIDPNAEPPKFDELTAIKEQVKSGNYRSAAQLGTNLAEDPSARRNLAQKSLTFVESEEGRNKSINEAMTFARTTGILSPQQESLLDYGLLKSGDVSMGDIMKSRDEAALITDPEGRLKMEILKLRSEIFALRLFLTVLDIPAKIASVMTAVATFKTALGLEALANNSGNVAVGSSLSQRLGGSRPQANIKPFHEQMMTQLVNLLDSIAKDMKLAAAAMKVNSLSMATAFIQNPYALVATAIAAGITLVEALTPKLNVVGTILGGLGSFASFWYGVVREILYMVGVDLDKNVQSVWGTIKGIWQTLTDWGAAIQTAKNYVGDIGTTMVDVMAKSADAGGAFVRWAVKTIGRFVGWLSGLFGGTSQEIDNHWQNTADSIVGNIDEIQQKSGVSSYEIQHNLAEGSPGLTERIRNFWKATVEKIQGWMGNLSQTAKEEGSDIEKAMTPEVAKASKVKVASPLAPVKSSIIGQLKGQIRDVYGTFQDEVDYLKDYGVADLDLVFEPGIEQLRTNVGQLGGDFLSFGKRATVAIATLNFGELIDAVGDFAGNFKFAIAGVLAGLGQIAIAALSTAAFFLGPFAPVVLLLGGIAFVGAAILANFLGIRQAIKLAFKVGIGLGQAFLGTVKGLAIATKGVFKIIFGLFAALRGDTSLLKEGLTDLKTGFRVMMRGWLTGLKTILGAFGVSFESIQNKAKQLFEFLSDGERVGRWLADKLVNGFKAVIRFVASIPDRVRPTLQQMGNQVGSWAKNLWTRLKTAIANFSFKDLFNLLKQQGQVGINVSLQGIKEQLIAWFKRLPNILQGPLGWLGGFFRGFANRIAEEFTDEFKAKVRVQLLRAKTVIGGAIASLLDRLGLTEKVDRWLRILKIQWRKTVRWLKKGGLLDWVPQNLQEASQMFVKFIGKVEAGWNRLTAFLQSSNIFPKLFSGLNKLAQFTLRLMRRMAVGWEMVRRNLNADTFSGFFKHLKNLGERFSTLMENLDEKVRKVTPAFTPIFTALWELGQRFTMVVEWVEGKWRKFAVVLAETGVIPAILKSFVGLAKRFVKATEWMKNSWRPFVQYLNSTDLFKNIFADLRRFGGNFPATVQTVKTKVVNLWQTAIAEIKSKWLAFTQNFGSFFRPLINFVRKISDWLVSNLAHNSPGPLKWIIEKWKAGIVLIGKIITKLMPVVLKLSAFLIRTFGRALAFVTSFFREFWTTVKPGLGEVGTAISRGARAFRTFVSNIRAGLSATGEMIEKSSGLSRSVARLKEALQPFIRVLKQFFSGVNRSSTEMTGAASAGAKVGKIVGKMASALLAFGAKVAPPLGKILSLLVQLGIEFGIFGLKVAWALRYVANPLARLASAIWDTSKSFFRFFVDVGGGLIKTTGAVFKLVGSFFKLFTEVPKGLKDIVAGLFKLNLTQFTMGVERIREAFINLGVSATKVLTTGLRLLGNILKHLLLIPLAVFDLMMKMTTPAGPVGIFNAVRNIIGAVFELIGVIKRLFVEAIPGFKELAAVISEPLKKLKQFLGFGDKVAQETGEEPAQKTKSAWQRTMSFIRGEARRTAEVAEQEGYEIQRNLSEGSPGITKFIRKHWAKTSDFMSRKMYEMRIDAELSGNSLQKNLIDTLDTASVTRGIEKMRSGVQGLAFDANLSTAKTPKLLRPEEYDQQLSDMKTQYGNLFKEEESLRNKYAQAPGGSANATRAETERFMQIKQEQALLKEKAKSIKALHAQSTQMQAMGEAAQSGRSALMSLGGALSNFAPQLATPLFMLNDFVDVFVDMKELMPTIRNLFRAQAAAQVASNTAVAASELAVAGASATSTTTQVVGAAAASTSAQAEAVAVGGANSFMATTYGLLAGAASAAYKVMIAPLLPFLPLILAIAAGVTALVVAFKTNFLGIADATRQVIDAVKLFFKLVVGGIWKTVVSVFQTFQREVEGVRDAFMNIGRTILEPFQPIFDAFGIGGGGNPFVAAVTGAANLILLPFQIVGKVLIGIIKLFGAIASGVAWVVGKLAGFVLMVSGIRAAVLVVAGVIKGIWTYITGAADIVAGNFSFLFTELGHIGKAFGVLGRSILAPFRPLFAAFGVGDDGKSKGNNVLGNAIVVAFKLLLVPLRISAFFFKVIVKAVSWLIQGIVYLGAALNTVLLLPTRAISTVIGGIITLIRNVPTMLGGMVQMLWGMIPAPLRWLMEKGGSFVGSAANLLVGNKEDTKIQKFATGGVVQGKPGRDRVPALVTAGEFVVNAASASRNMGLLQAINNGRAALPMPTALPPELVKIPAQLLRFVADSVSPESKEDLPPINVNFNFGDIVLTGTSGAQAAAEFLDEIDLQLQQKVRWLLRDMVEKMR